MARRKKLPRSCLFKLYKGVWLFPAVLTVLLLSLTALQISGSSIGIYHSILYGNSKDDPSLIANQPRLIRSDEWLVSTQLTIAQSAAGYPRVNPNIDTGRDMSLVGDAPYKDWSAAFKPQNLAFFVLPLTYAFAFKWWLLLYLVIISCYFVVLRLFAGRRLLAALIGSAVGLSPFLFWWYATGVFAPMFYGFFIILVGLRIIDGEKARFLKKRAEYYSYLLYAAALAYLLTAFALILYPPFQIPIALSVAAFLAGYTLNKYGPGKSLLSKDALKRIGIFAISCLITGAVVLLFINTRSQAVSAIRHTVYPGVVDVQGGHTPVFEIFSTYLQPQLERVVRGTHYYTNQSEASNFLLLLPFLLLPGFLLILLEYKQKRRINWPLLFVQLLATLFLLDLFVPVFQPVYKLFLLNKIAPNRLFIGLGFLGVLQLLLIMRSLASIRITKARLNRSVVVYVLACLGVLGWAGKYVSDHYPLFIHNELLIAFFGIFFAVIIFCFLSRRFTLAAALFLVFAFGSVFRIHPLYRGLGPVYRGELSQAIEAASQPEDSWAVLDNLFPENFALMANRDSLTGVKPYPDVSFWRQVEGPKSDYIYNRYAHVVFASSPSWNSPLRLIQTDFFKVRLSCSNFIRSNVDFLLNTSPVNQPCFRLKDKVVYPAATFYIYEVR